MDKETVISDQEINGTIESPKQLLDKVDSKATSAKPSTSQTATYMNVSRNSSLNLNITPIASISPSKNP